MINREQIGTIQETDHIKLSKKHKHKKSTYLEISRQKQQWKAIGTKSMETLTKYRKSVFFPLCSERREDGNFHEAMIQCLNGDLCTANATARNSAQLRDRQNGLG